MDVHDRAVHGGTQPEFRSLAGARSLPGPWTARSATMLLAVFCLSSLPSASRGQAPSSSADASDRTVDSLVRVAVDAGFSGQVLVADDGDIVLHRGYGPANPETGTVVDTSTVFAIGSVTKRFTRVAVLKLEEEGRLSTSDPVSLWLDGLPEDKRRITVGQLLDMESGLGEYHDDTGDHQAMSRDEALRRIRAQDLRFEPGSDRAYSNSGYTLLAAIVEEASGRSFERYLREEILQPAGMRRTGFHGDSLWADGEVARGYGMRTFGENAPHRWPSTTWALKGAEGMVAPAADLLRFIRALREGKIVGETALAELHPPDRGDLVYAGGDDFGFVTVVMELDHGEHVVIVNTNHGYEYEWLPGALAASVRGEPLAERTADGESPRVRTGEPGGPPEGVGQSADGPGQSGRLPASPRGRAAGWLLSALEDGSTEALRTLVEDRFTSEMRDAVAMDEHLNILGQLARRVAAEGVLGVRPESEHTFVLVLGGGDTVTVDISPSPPHLIEGIRIGAGRR